MKGEPKKQGGGRFGWGKADGKSDLELRSELKGDPNYNSEDEVVYQAYEQPSVEYSPIRTPLPVYSRSHFAFDSTELKIAARTKTEEVFKTESFPPFVQWVKSLKNPKTHSVILGRVIQVAIEVGPREQELALGLIELLHSSRTVSSTQLRRAFDRLYREIQEVLTDVPNGAEVLLEFLVQVVQYGLLEQRAVFRVPLEVYNLGRGAYVLREIRVDNTVVGDLVENSRALKDKITGVLTEYYANGVILDIAEFLKKELPQLTGHLFLRKAIELAFDKNNSQKELCSRLLCEVQGTCSPEMYVEAFDDLLWNIHEYCIDVPPAGELLAKFMARAVADDCLAPKYLGDAELSEPDTENPEVEVLQSAQNLLKPLDSFTTLQSVWRPDVVSNTDYKEEFRTIVQEYFDSQDARNAKECLKGLCCPQYMHAFVKKAIEISMDKTDKEQEDTISLLVFLVEHGVVSEAQLEKGLERTQEGISDLQLDVPRAPEILERFLTRFK